jgi:integrase
VGLALAPVKAMLATAVGDGLIRSNPAANVRIAIAPPASYDDEAAAKALTDEELARLLAQVAPGWRPLVHLIAQTGVRISEALAIRWGDLDVGQRRPHVRRRARFGRVGPPKSRYGRRSIPLGDELARDLWSRRKAAERAQDADLVFASTTGGSFTRRTCTRGCSSRRRERPASRGAASTRFATLARQRSSVAV